MAGYSGTPLARKLGIKGGATVILAGAPAGFEATLEPLPEEVGVVRRPVDDADVALLFVTERADLVAQFPALGARLRPTGGLWVAWPKKSSRIATDLTENVLREVCLPLGWVDNKVCAVDDTWSGLRFVLRLENRPGRQAPPSAPPHRERGLPSHRPGRAR